MRHSTQRFLTTHTVFSPQNTGESPLIFRGGTDHLGDKSLKALPSHVHSRVRPKCYVGRSMSFRCHLRRSTRARVP